MKIQLKFEFQDNSIPKNYRAVLLSFFKHSLSKYNEELFAKNYSEKYSIKNFCFAVYMKNSDFTGDNVKFDEFAVNFSIADFSDGIDWYNSFVKMKNIEYPLPMNNKMTLKSVKIENHKEIKDNIILIKMLSPIAVRKVVDAKSIYYSCFDDKFIPVLKDNILTMLSLFTEIDKDKIPLEIVPIKPKKTVTYAFGSNITANLGIYKIASDTMFLNLIYMLGIGSRRSEGFGMFEVIG